MGRGDRKTRKGKIFAASYGVYRKRKPATTTIVEQKSASKKKAK